MNIEIPNLLYHDFFVFPKGENFAVLVLDFIKKMTPSNCTIRRINIPLSNKQQRNINNSTRKRIFNNNVENTASQTGNQNDS